MHGCTRGGGWQNNSSKHCWAIDLTTATTTLTDYKRVFCLLHWNSLNTLYKWRGSLAVSGEIVEWTAGRMCNLILTSLNKSNIVHISCMVNRSFYFTKLTYMKLLYSIISLKDMYTNTTLTYEYICPKKNTKSTHHVHTRIRCLPRN